MTSQNSLPRMSRIEFFRYCDDELACAISRAITAHVELYPDAQLTEHHAAISAWCAAAMNVPNGGFTQFFYNRQGDQGVKELAVLLDTLGLSKAATLLRDSATIYRQHRTEFMTSNPWEGLFGSIQELEKLNRPFMKFVLRCCRAIGSWVQVHIAALVVDETGAPIDPKFTGTVELWYPNGQIKESLEVKKGKPHGVYRVFFEDGNIREAVYYKLGKVSGDFWPDGQVKRKESKQGAYRLIQWFYPSGALQKRFVVDKGGYAAEPIRLYHENGQLAEEVNTVEDKKLGPWLKFFDDGSPELQAEYGEDEKLIVHNAWNENREQIVKDGTGKFRDYPFKIDWRLDVFFKNGWPREAELRNGIPHGKVITTRRGLVWSIEDFAAGQRDGVSTTYWDNGRVRHITQYTQGKAGKTTEFPRSEHFVPAVVLTVQADEELYAAWRHQRVDEYPRPLNLEAMQKQVTIPQFLLEVHERNQAGTLRDSYEDWNTFDDGIAYILTVDESGITTDAFANGSGVYSGGHWDTYLPLLRELRFTPARVSGDPIECQVLARVDHKFIEGSP